MNRETHRDLDILIIGAMKSGTTALAWALGSLPEVELAKRKEVNFFSDDENWNRGVTWYQSNFSRSALMSGEALPSYTFPENPDRVAQRIRSLYPRIRLIFTGRDQSSSSSACLLIRSRLRITLLLSKNVANQRPLSSCGSRVLWNEPTFYRCRFGIMANSRLDQRITEIPTSARFLFGRVPGEIADLIRADTRKLESTLGRNLWDF